MSQLEEAKSEQWTWRWVSALAATCILTTIVLGGQCDMENTREKTKAIQQCVNSGQHPLACREALQR